MKRTGFCIATGLLALALTGCSVKDYLEDITADSEYTEPEPEPESTQSGVPDTEDLNSLLDQLTEQPHADRTESPHEVLPTDDDLLHDLLHDDTLPTDGWSTCFVRRIDHYVRRRLRLPQNFQNTDGNSPPSATNGLLARPLPTA